MACGAGIANEKPDGIIRSRDRVASEFFPGGRPGGAAILFVMAGDANAGAEFSRARSVWAPGFRTWLSQVSGLSGAWFAFFLCFRRVQAALRFATKLSTSRVPLRFGLLCRRIIAGISCAHFDQACAEPSCRQQRS